jgi:hypothetical protein
MPSSTMMPSSPDTIGHTSRRPFQSSMKKSFQAPTFRRGRRAEIGRGGRVQRIATPRGPCLRDLHARALPNAM